MPRPFLIDTDTASDDAVALIMALRAKDVDVQAITVVAGNVPLEQAMTNALYVTQICDCKTPVYAGASKPLLRVYEDATWFHGKDGLGDQNYPKPRCKPAPGHAVDAIIKHAEQTPDLTLVTLGPLTNIAMALLRAPHITQNISRCVVMGGNPCCEGNVTPAAEYNIWVDPDAAQIVFHSGLAIEMVGWQLCRGDAVLSEPDISHVRSLGTDLANFCIDCNRTAMEAYRTQSGEIGIALPDPVAMAVAIDPSIATQASDHLVEIETHSDLTRGQTVVDRLKVASDSRNRGLWSTITSRPSSIVWQIDIPRWKQLLYQSLTP